MKKNKSMRNTIEAYACSCIEPCSGCTAECNFAYCACDTTFFDNPMADLSFDDSADQDTSASIKEGSTSPEWSRYNK